MVKYIFVAGGVMSGVGKGVALASMGRVLKSYGFKVGAIKIDPYVNVDAGTMNPIEHGEIFVTNDGAECDQDIGNYERFLEEDLSNQNYITTGKIYSYVIAKERNLAYKGRCVEVVPDIPNEVIRRIKFVAKKDKLDIILVEIGGTVGEYQNLIFLEAARILKLTKPNDIVFVLVSYLPVPRNLGEMKTKPTQTAVRLLHEAGIQPDFILARAPFPLDEPRRRKISIFCNIKKDNVISAPDSKIIYEIPNDFEKEKIGKKIMKKLGLRAKKKDFKKWDSFVKKIKRIKKTVKIGIVGKYFKSGEFNLLDSYISVIEAIKHASWALNRSPEIVWLSSEEYEKDSKKLVELKKFDGIIVPGGFGARGIEGKIKVIEFCRKNKIPFLGLCLGMQLAVIEFSRNVCGFKGANSKEFDPNTEYPVIDLMDSQKSLLKSKKYGGTMRLGAYQCQLSPDSISFKAYGKEKYILERHRHRYEFNNKFKDILEKKGLKIAGVNPEKNLVEIVEIPNHPFFIAVQFHPEFKSRPLSPHPLFKEFIRSAIKNN